MENEVKRRGPGRPQAASRDEVERVAIEMMLRDGYDEVTVDAIATAVGIGRTTFFRYFSSKGAVVWSAFDDTIGWLHDGLEKSHDASDALDAIRASIVASTRTAIYASNVWLDRFILLDRNPALRSGAYWHWEQWKSVIADYLIDAVLGGPGNVISMGIAGACHGVFLAELRNWLHQNEHREDFLAHLDDDLAAVLKLLRPLLKS